MYYKRSYPSGYNGLSYDNEREYIIEHQKNYEPSYIDPKYFFNRKEGTIFGRTPLGCCLTITFYLIFYTILIGITAGMYVIFLIACVDEDVPTMNGPSSPLGLKPGLAIRPTWDFHTTLIRYRTSDPQSYMIHVQTLRAFLELYEQHNLQPQDGFADCTESGRSTRDPDRVCKFELKRLEFCQRENNYGYDRSQPCVILKMNKVFGWLPSIQNTTLANHALVVCEGQNEGDIENFATVNYYPNKTMPDGKTYGYFDSNFYPFLSQQAYRQPLVALHFINPKKFVVLMVKCRVFNLMNGGGEVKFELFVD